MKKIVAIIKNQYLDTYWGFIFNTEIQSFVEDFMVSIHRGANDYFLAFEEDKPEGVYTDVEVLPEYNEDGSVYKLTFKL